MELSKRWQEYFATIAHAVKTASKDPSTQVGAVIYRPDLSIASTGFNGLPRGMPDSEEILENRDLKYPRIVHAEANAIYHARESLVGCGIVITAPPCSKCALACIAAGIKTIYYTADETIMERWADEITVSHSLASESGVKLIKID